jgi:hypothetical protein
MAGSTTTRKKYKADSNEAIVRETVKCHKMDSNLCLYVGLDTILGIRLCQETYNHQDNCIQC